jgi:hypothetical protein
MDLYCRWLYQTARADGKPRLLFLGNMDMAPIYLFIDRLKQVKVTRWHKKYFFVGFSNSHASRHFLHPNYFARRFPTTRDHLVGQWQNQRKIADKNGKSGFGGMGNIDFTLSARIYEKMDCGK